MPAKVGENTPRKTFRIPKPHEDVLIEAVESGRFPTKTATVLHGIELVKRELEVVE